MKIGHRIRRERVFWFPHLFGFDRNNVNKLFFLFLFFLNIILSSSKSQEQLWPHFIQDHVPSTLTQFAREKHIKMREKNAWSFATKLRANKNKNLNILHIFYFYYGHIPMLLLSLWWDDIYGVCVFLSCVFLVPWMVQSLHFCCRTKLEEPIPIA